MSPQWHPRDVPEEDLQRALASSLRPDLLQALVDLSRRHFGFFSRFTSHTLTYPWAVAHLEKLGPGARALDVGSGLSPIPPFLAESGVLVDCVDGHPEVRSPPISADWTEWGFFDYSAVHPALRSHHCMIEEFRPPEKFDAIYSVCVLTHMPRSNREVALRLIQSWLKDNGVVVLAFDLLPNTNYLWNRQKKTVFAPPAEHGTIADILTSMAVLNLRIDDLTIIRNVPNGRPDLFMVKAVQST